MDKEDNIIVTIKAMGDLTLSILGIPYNGQNDGRDSDGERFTPGTETMHDQFKTIPIFHYHGMDKNQNPVSDPEPIGSATYSHTDAAGEWWTAVLDGAKTIAHDLYRAAENFTLRASSGAIAHLVRKAKDGTILVWPVAELSLMDISKGMLPANNYAVALPAAKLHYKSAKLSLPTLGEKMDPTIAIQEMLTELGVTVTPELVQSILDAIGTPAAPAMNADAAPSAAPSMEETIRKIVAEMQSAQTATGKAVAAARKEWEAEAAKNNRLPNPKQAPAQAKYGETWKYDNFTPGDLSFAAQVMGSRQKQVSPALIKALALKMENDKDPNTGFENRQALKAAHIKADETDYTSNSTFGSDWVGTAYGSELWLAVRDEANVAGRIPVGPDIPQGYISQTIPIESTDPTFYHVPEATDSTFNSTTLVHNATTPSGGPSTANKSMTVGKMGARSLYSGEMEEDSLVAFAANARRQMGIAASEAMDYVVINGDTDLSASTNINAIDTTPAATTLFSITNGFRKLALVTNTANSRSAGGSLDITDFIETVKLMGTAGRNARTKNKVDFIVDLNTYWKALNLPEVLTKDVNSQATVESGELTRLYGYGLIASGFFHGGVAGYASTKLLANTAGKVDADTEANNLYGAILSVRWDQWQMRFKRRWSIKASEFIESDTYQIVGMSRFGIGARDNEAAAITYYVGV